MAVNLHNYVPVVTFTIPQLMHSSVSGKSQFHCSQYVTQRLLEDLLSEYDTEKETIFDVIHLLIT